MTSTRLTVRLTRMIARFLVLTLFSAILAGCVDDPQGCHQAGGVWDGIHCSAR